MAIEIRSKKTDPKSREGEVLVDGVICASTAYQDFDGYFEILWKSEELNLLESLTFRELQGVNIRRVQWHKLFFIINEKDTVTIEVKTMPGMGSVGANSDIQKVPYVRFGFAVSTHEWNKPYTFKELRTELTSRLREADKNSDIVEIGGRRITRDWYFDIKVRPNELIGDVVGHWFKLSKEACSSSMRAMLQRLNADSLVTFFSFSPGTEVACKQYLIYFAQFLADMGVEAETEFEQEDKVTILKVIPKDKNESLQKIKEALDAYLYAATPESSTALIRESSNDIAFLQWQANILHLQGQLTLYKSIISAKDAEIAAKTDHIEMLKLSTFQISNQIALENPKKSVEHEQIIPGVVSVSKMEIKGVTINLAEIVKRLKRTIMKGS
jgi:hypothetical protein